MITKLLTTFFLVHATLAAADREMGTFTPKKNPLSDFLFFEKVMLNQEKEVQTSLQKGTNPNQKDVSSRRALHFAKTPEMVQLLVSFGADPNKSAQYGETPLHTTHTLSKIIALLQAGALPEKTNFHGNTALHQVGEVKGGEKLVQEYIQRGVQVNHQSRDGNTALHCTVGYFFFSLYRTEKSFKKYPRPQEVFRILTTLVKAGASLTIKNNDLKTPFDIAMQKIKDNPNYLTFHNETNKQVINEALDLLNPTPDKPVFYH